MQVSFRRSISKKIDNYALTAWLRMGEITASKKEVGPYNKQILLKNIEKIRKLTTESPSTFSAKLIELCAEAGVVLIYVPHLKRTKVNGATYWLNDTPVIQMSLFNKYADIFWFTLFHEIGHILKHGKKASFIDIDWGNMKIANSLASISSKNFNP